MIPSSDDLLHTSGCRANQPDDRRWWRVQQAYYNTALAFGRSLACRPMYRREESWCRADGDRECQQPWSAAAALHLVLLEAMRIRELHSGCDGRGRTAIGQVCRRANIQRWLRQRLDDLRAPCCILVSCAPAYSMKMAPLACNNPAASSATVWVVSCLNSATDKRIPGSGGVFA